MMSEPCSISQNFPGYMVYVIRYKNTIKMKVKYLDEISEKNHFSVGSAYHLFHVYCSLELYNVLSNGYGVKREGAQNGKKEGYELMLQWKILTRLRFLLSKLMLWR